ncbi:MAG: hypothetical protein KDK70_14690 [Myxococcales bacterium]|nr:hypothetical protein [Myxococcales bacterium]
MIEGLAQRLAACEDRSLFPGPLQPREVGVDPDTGAVSLRAEALVRSLCGATTPTTTGSPGLSRWVPPAQARGEPWDGAAKRYVVGLVLYRALAGHHPFSGQGLRRGLAEQADRGAPPLAEDVAAALPPGLQSLCLSLLEPEPSQRPPSSAVLLERLRALAGGTSTGTSTEAVVAVERPAEGPEAPVRAAGVGSAPTSVPASAAASPRAPSPWWRRLSAMVPVVGGLGLAAVVSAMVEPPPVAVAPGVGVVQPLTLERTRPDDCAQCHPRQVAQWTQSVMAHSARSPLFQALELLIEEQAGRDFDCPEGAGVLRRADPRTACRDAQSGLPITGAGGEHWCVNCHTAGENLRASMPAWDGRFGRAGSRLPLRDLLPEATMDGISCVVCHTAHGPVRPGDAAVGRYEGNPTWNSLATGRPFFMRPEDLQGKPGIANSGYSLDVDELLPQPGDPTERLVPGGVHRRPTDQARAYVRSSEFCGSCHDVRLFGTDGAGIRNGEHFKRLRNAYTEWALWADDARAKGKTPPSCQDCHMSLFPGICVAGAATPDPKARVRAVALERACPPGTHFESHEPGDYPTAPMAAGTGLTERLTTHYFTGVDVPLTPEFDDAFIDQPTLDGAGIPLGAEQRRDILLGRSFRFEIEGERLVGSRLELPLVIENVTGGHRIPAGFSQEREFWVHLTVTDAKDRLVYEVGKVERGDEDLADKIFVRVNVDDGTLDAQGQPVGVFGADVRNGPDHPEWTPDPALGGTEFRGHGLINFQNGFLRCVRCIGDIDAQGRCQPKPSQRELRADRFEDGAFDIDTGICTSNLTGMNAYYETYFPVGSLDAERGTVRGPDIIIDTRSVPPEVPVRYVYDLPVGGFSAPLRVEARLMFRAFPPFLVRGFADYEAHQASKGLRPSGPLVTHDMLERLEAVELVRVVTTVTTATTRARP